jgi:hypothetical protein
MDRRSCLITLSALACSATGCAVPPGREGMAPLLPQQGNPLGAALESYRRWLSRRADPAVALGEDRRLADNIVSWQMPHGGFYKETRWYANRWDGKAARSGWLGAGGVELARSTMALPWLKSSCWPTCTAAAAMRSTAPAPARRWISC